MVKEKDINLLSSKEVTLATKPQPNVPWDTISIPMLSILKGLYHVMLLFTIDSLAFLSTVYNIIMEFG